MSSPIRFKLIVPSYNAMPWLEWSLQSIARQTYKNYDVCVIDDASTMPRQRAFIERFCRRHGWSCVLNPANLGALANIVAGIDRLACRDEDVIVLVDGDDWLYGPHVLSRLAKVYRREPVSLTYGQHMVYSTERNLIRGNCRPVPPQVIDQRRFREIPFAFSHLRTFKHFLWRQIDDSSLRDEQGNYFKTAWDLAIMYPLLEMAGHSTKYLHDILYVYNRVNPLNDVDTDPVGQQMAERYIRSLPRYSRRVEQRLPLDSTNLWSRFRTLGILAPRLVLKKLGWQALHEALMR
jgi:glycosyltransferase involved in cell wall biosynthesis